MAHKYLKRKPHTQARQTVDVTILEINCCSLIRLFILFNAEAQVPAGIVKGTMNILQYIINTHTRRKIYLKKKKVVRKSVRGVAEKIV